MKPTILAVAAALALGTLAACDRGPTPEQRPATTPPATTAPSSTAPASTAPAGAGTSANAPSNTPSTPANVGAPSATEKSDGSKPVQGQVDSKEPEQRKDFQQKGDGAGPKPGG